MRRTLLALIVASVVATPAAAQDRVTRQADPFSVSVGELSPARKTRRTLKLVVLLPLAAGILTVIVILRRREAGGPDVAAREDPWVKAQLAGRRD